LANWRGDDALSWFAAEVTGIPLVDGWGPSIVSGGGTASARHATDNTSVPADTSLHTHHTMVTDDLERLATIFGKSGTGADSPERAAFFEKKTEAVNAEMKRKRVDNIEKRASQCASLATSTDVPTDLQADFQRTSKRLYEALLVCANEELDEINSQQESACRRTSD
jgi:hypothetical protein